jgi:D-glycero-alpha-D-manno-heptose 1-phosphate guanylyltransferase
MITTAVILAGGLGTRLRSVVSDRPKPMADVSGKPFLEYLIDRLVSRGITKVVICVSYMKENIISHITAKYGDLVSFSVEEQPLGTGGALSLASSLLPESFLVLNGDTFLSLDYDSLEAFHKANDADMTIVLTKPSGALIGNVVLGRSNRIVEFGEVESESALVNAGVYLMEHKVVDKIERGVPVSLEKQFFPKFVKEANVYGYVSENNFIDMGTPKSYFYLLENSDILKK